MTYDRKLKEHSLLYITIGEFKEKVSAVRESRGIIDDKMITKILHINEKTLETIIDLIDSNPDWDDEDIAEELYDNM